MQEPEAQEALGTAFTYQGRLTDAGGEPVNDLCAFTFELYDTASGGSPLGRVNTSANVTDGRFTVQLDFGTGAFDGDARYLDVVVDCGDGEHQFDQRQALTPAPYALYAAGAPWAGLTDVPADIADGDDDTTYDAGTGLTLSGTTFGVDFAGSGATNTVARSDHDHDGIYAPADHDHDDRYWALGGNAGTDTSSDVLGTTDEMTLTVVVSDTPALRIVPAPTAPNVIAGSTVNSVEPDVSGATIAGGGRDGDANSVISQYGTVGGGFNNVAGDPSSIANCCATIGGGANNTASERSTTVAGGAGNTASGMRAAVGGGRNNVASSGHTTVGGGEGNTASGFWATVGGGDANTASNNYATVAGGTDNVASAHSASIGGGLENTVSGLWATVPGGRGNAANGSRSFAAGHQAIADHDGTFVWGDSTFSEIYSGGEDQFIVRANGGLWLGRATDDLTPTIGSGIFISTSTGAHLTDGGTWTNASDRAAKVNFRPVDGQEVLHRLVEVPIRSWSYKAEDASVRHLGPVAQDFYAAFGLGESDTHISTVDADGVALAAIQGLYDTVQTQEARIATLEDENEALNARVNNLEARVNVLEQSTQDDDPRSGLPLSDSAWLVAALLIGLVLWQRRSERRVL